MPRVSIHTPSLSSATIRPALILFVPPALRSQGFARSAVALHLAEARTGGASRAVLFAATQAAFRAYQAIGFNQTGWMGLALLHKSMVPA